MSSSKFEHTITNEPIRFEDKLSLPEISFYANHDRRFVYPNAPSLPVHIHDDYEIYVHVEGDSAFLVDNKVYPLRRGDVILTRPGDIHVFIPDRECMAEHFCLWLPPVCGTQLLPFTQSNDFFPHRSFSEETAEQLLSLLYRITAEEDRPRDLEKISLILQIILILSAPSQGLPRTARSLPEEMQKILDHIETELGQIISVEDIATRFNISTATLNRRFRQYVHLSPCEYLKAKRLSYAKKLLDNGATVTESCMQSGFSDCSYFISVFKKNFGETPHHYKRKGTE